METGLLRAVSIAATVVSYISFALRVSRTLIRFKWLVIHNNIGDYGLARGLALETIFFQARRVVERIRTHVFLHPEHTTARKAQEAWSIKKSYTESFSMIAVAVKGAIVAQIAITALSLEYLEDTHWTASAAFVISLVAGLLSVYYACILQQQLSGLHSPEETLRWLTTVRAFSKVRLHRKMIRAGLWPHGQTFEGSDFMPSFNAALLLVVPSILLNWSSIALLIGIGIYFGMIYTENLGSLRGDNSNLAILLVYVLFTFGALMGYLWPLLQKALESTPPAESTRKRLSDNYNDHVEAFAQRPRPNSGDNGFIDLRNIDLSDQRRFTTDPLPVPPTHNDSSRMETNAQASTQPQVPGSEFIRSHPSTASASGGSQIHAITQRPLRPSTKLANDAIEMQTVTDALQASIAAQKASLQAQELLLATLRPRERPQPRPRRASL